MAKKIDELIIEIRADTKGLQKELNGVKKRLGNTGKAGKTAFVPFVGGLGKAKIAAAAFAGVAVMLTKRIAEVSMVFEDLQDSLNVVFGSMEAGNQAMDRVLQFAQTTPFQIETVTRAFISLKSVGIEPTNEMLQTFADTASVSIDQLGVFQALVRTVQRGASGGLGLEELNMLDDRGIPALKILQEELGLARMDIAKFGVTVKGAKIITDALQEGLSKRFGGAMETKMDNLSTKTSNMTIAFKQLANEVFESGLGNWLKSLADSLTDLADASARAIAASRGAGTGVKLQVATWDKGATPAEKRTARINTASANVDSLLAAKHEVENPPSDVSYWGGRDQTTDADRKALADRLALVNKELKIQQDLITRLKEGKGILSEQEIEDLMRQGELQRAYSFVSGVIEKHIGDTDDLTFAMDNLTDIISENEEAFALLGMTQDEVRTILQNLKDETNDMATISDELRQAIASQAHTFTNDFVNALMDGESALESFKNFAKSMVSQIISIFLQMAVVNEILNAVFGLTGSNQFATIRNTRAGGGTVQANTPVLVGERGAEIFVPNTGGTVMNHANSARAMGGQNIVVNQSLNFATGVVPTVRTEIIKMLPQISEVTKASVFEAATRGGQFGKALRGGVG